MVLCFGSVLGLQLEVFLSYNNIFFCQMEAVFKILNLYLHLCMEILKCLVQ